MIRAIVVLIALTSVAIAADLPNPKLTSGVATVGMTAAKLCAKGFTTKSVRNVPMGEKVKVYVEYGMSKKKPPCPCEVDHLISLELGGSNDIKNLWPQSYTTMPWNAHVKDKLENRLHKLVCTNKMTLSQAQQCISRDWVTCYKKWMR